MKELDDLKKHLQSIDEKVDKAVGRDVKPIHYIMIALLLAGIISNLIS